MQCPELGELASFLAGALSADQRETVHSHVVGCESCRQVMARIREDHDLQLHLQSALSAHNTTTGLAAENANRPATDSIPGYSIIREIHRGGQGVVYQAIQQATKRKVAIKVMKEGPFADRRDRARFEREVEILGQLNHPNIIGVHDSGSAGGSFYFVMDYVSGQPLDTWMATGDHTIKETLQLFAKICEAVNAAHLRGVIHRDLKPGNIRIDAVGGPHVLDFGLAKTAGASDLSVMTMTGQFMGSLPWASPEQAEAIPEKIDIRTDVYSLGVILYQMLTGKFPYDAVGNMRDVLDRIMKTEPTRPSAIRKQINDEVETIVLKSLSKERERRYQSAGELMRDIHRYLAGEPIEAKRDSALYVLKTSLRRYKVPFGIGAGLAILSIAAAVAFMILAEHNRDLANSNQRLATQERASRIKADGAATQMAEARDDAIRQKNEAMRAREHAVAARVLEAKARADATSKEREALEAAAEAVAARTKEADAKKEALLRAQEAQAAAVEARTQREAATTRAAEALKQANKARTISDFLQKMLAHAIPTAANHADLRVHDILDEAARRVDMTPPGDPETEAAVRYTVGVSYFALGLNAAAENQMSKALQIRTQIAGPESLEVADTLFEWAKSKYKTDQARAAEMMTRALAIRRSHLGETHPSTLRASSWSAALSRSDGDWQEGIIRPYLPLLTGKPGNESVAKVWMAELCARVTLRWKSGDHLGAVSAIREAFAPLLSDPELRNDVVTVISMLPCEPEAAEPIARAAISISGPAQGIDDLATADLLLQLAINLRAKPQPDYLEIERLMRRAIAIRKKLLGERHSSIAEITQELAATYAQQSRYWKALLLESSIAAFGSSLKVSEYRESWKTKRQDSSDFLRRSRRVCDRGWIPDWAPDGKRIAVARPGARGIATIDLQSSEEKDLTSFGKDPAWSPDGHRIAFVNEMEGEPTILVYDFKSRQSRLLGEGHRPRWSRDGKILYFARRSDRSCVWAVNPDGPFAKATVFAREVPPGFPTLSPDASLVACSKTNEFLVLKLDGTPMAAVPATRASWLHTSWSPDGKKVSFGGGRSFAGLSVFDVSSGNVQLLCEGPYVTLAWSPDGTHVAFDYRGPDGENEVWIADAQVIDAQPSLEISAYTEYLYGKPVEQWLAQPAASRPSSGTSSQPARGL